MNKAQEQKLTIKASNLEAHLAVVKQEVTKENNTLNRVVSERKLAEAQATRSIREAEAAEKELAKSVALANQELNKVKTAKEELVKADKEVKADRLRLASDKVKFEDAKKWELVVLEDEKDVIRDEMQDMVDYQNKTQVAFATEEKNYESQILSLEGEATTKQDELDEVMASLSAAQETLSEVKNALTSSEKEKEVLSVEIEDILESKATIFKNLEDREVAVSKREHDTGVIVRRLEKAYKRLYPNKELTI